MESLCKLAVAVKISFLNKACEKTKFRETTKKKKRREE